MIKGKLDKVLSKYFTNYHKSNLKLGLLSGKINLNNLYFNIEEINKELSAADLPISMKYGLLSNLDIDISYLNLQLELLEIDSLVIVLQPQLDAMSEVETEYTQ